MQIWSNKTDDQSLIKKQKLSIHLLPVEYL